MKSVKVILAGLSLSALSLAQTSRQPKPVTPPSVTQPQVLELSLMRESGPIILFERASKDKEGRCAVHRHHLEVAVVPIIYGLMPGFGNDYYKAERGKFPNAITRYEAGCSVMSAKEAKVLQCRKCLKGKAAYEKKRRGSS